MPKSKSNCVWITGASSGIGKAAAKEFARVGSKVYVSARRATELERLKRELKEEKLSVEVLPCNVASSANVDQSVKKIAAEGRISCLVNNAGITSFKSAVDNSIPEINDIIKTNLLGSIFAIKYVLPHMINDGGGTIINILSSAVKKTFLNSTAYTASKQGLLGYTDVLREEVRDKGIRVVNIIPGATETPMWSIDTRKEKADKMMTAEDVARVLVWVYLQKGNMVSEEIVLKPITGDL
ncbi:MAG: SDR family oxidoreductase [Ignavibacteriaceae bacterium]